MWRNADLRFVAFGSGKFDFGVLDFDGIFVDGSVEADFW
jgi:hypothetical protein